MDVLSMKLWRVRMKKYLIEYKYGIYTTKEFNWSITKDANKPYAYDDILDAVEEMGYINDLIESYRIKSVDLV